jgi:hypothetical protein
MVALEVQMELRELNLLVVAVVALAEPLVQAVLVKLLSQYSPDKEKS